MATPAFGTGLNRIPVRFALLSFVLTCCALLGAASMLGGDVARHSAPAIGLLVAGVALVPSLVTYLAAARMTAAIEALRRSTEAIAKGDLNTRVEVDCACEIGGLADGFRRMVERLNDNIRRMNTLAYTDPITGLPNRTVFNHVLDLASRRPAADPCRGALFFIDLDGFKAVNDTLGHRSGDELLRQVSHRILTDGFNLRPDRRATCTNAFGELTGDCPDEVVFARFAGDEFVALIPGRVARDELAAVARAIRDAVRRPFTVFGQEVVIGCSIGIARAPVDTANPHELLSLADFAMYMAKQRGKNAFVFSSPELRRVAIEKSEIEADLRRAVEDGVIALEYQPKLDAEGHALIGVEALARWRHPTRGAMSPAMFVPLAEKAGIMPALGRVVFNTAIRQCRDWSDRGLRVPVAVNVSSGQFEDPGFVEELLDIIRRHGVDPALVEIEITETTLVSDFPTAAAKIAALRSAGLSVAIDDFGVGFSNLSQLSRLPVSTIKIDRSLIEQIGLDRKSETIVRALIGMAQTLGLRTIAEGIELQQHAAFLRAARCDGVQGFLFGAPMTPADFETWYQARGQNGAVARHAHLRRVLADGSLPS